MGRYALLEASEVVQDVSVLSQLFVIFLKEQPAIFCVNVF